MVFRKNTIMTLYLIFITFMKIMCHTKKICMGWPCHRKIELCCNLTKLLKSTIILRHIFITYNSNLVSSCCRAIYLNKNRRQILHLLMTLIHTNYYSTLSELSLIPVISKIVIKHHFIPSIAVPIINLQHLQEHGNNFPMV